MPDAFQFTDTPRPVATRRQKPAKPDRSLVSMLLWFFGGLQAVGGVIYSVMIGLPVGAFAWIPFLAAAVGIWGFATVIDLLTEIRDELRRKE